jgi:hypothetical protein
MVVVAQLVRALDCGSRSRGFEPHLPPRIGAVVQLVRMPACHAGGREFESRQHRIWFVSSVGRAGSC